MAEKRPRQGGLAAPSLPAMPIVSPASRSKETPSTTRFTRPAALRQETTRSRTLRRGSRTRTTPRRIQPSASANPSAARLMPSTSVAIAAAGARTSQGSLSSSAMPSSTIRPQSGVGGEMPRPRKDSAETSSSAEEARSANSTAMRSATFGSNSRRTMVARFAVELRRADIALFHQHDAGGARRTHHAHHLDDTDRHDQHRHGLPEAGDEDRDEQDGRHRASFISTRRISTSSKLPRR